MRGTKRLTAIEVAGIVQPGRYADGDGLYLQVAHGGSKQWLLRFMRNGRSRQMGLGSVRVFTLKEARERARLARQQLADDIDPIDARRGRRMQASAEASKQVRFKEAAESYIAAHRAGWTNATHARQWATTLETYAYPVLGGLSVAAIETAHVLKVIEPLWTTKTETASRVRGRIEAVLDWAKARGFRYGENPALWKGHLDHLLPARAKVAKVKHLDALPYDAMPEFMAKLRSMESISARALEFTILTAARTGEAIGAKWSEIDFAAKLWTVPAERTKAGREHRVPLSDRALGVLSSVRREEGNPHLFIGRAGKGIHHSLMLELVREIDGSDLTVHGFRSSFRDWAAEQTNHSREVAEAALAHIVGDKTEAAYRRGDALEKRRKLMQAWAGYCARPAQGSVVQIRKARA